MHEQAGVTRDRKEVEADWNGRGFTLVDTGGVDLAGEHELADEIRHQARRRSRRPTLAVLVVDARAGLRPGDAELARELRGGPVPAIVVANKVDEGDPARARGRVLRARPGRAAAGVGDAGARHRRPARPDRRAAARARAPRPEEATRAGADRPPQRRQVVAGQPAARRGAGDRHADRRHHARRDRHPDRVRRARGRAGRHGRAAPPDKVAGSVDYYAQLRSEQAADRAQVAIVVCDATEGVTSEDFRIAEMAMKKKCATVIALNKWDVDPRRTSRTPRRAW